MKQLDMKKCNKYIKVGYYKKVKQKNVASKRDTGP